MNDPGGHPFCPPENPGDRPGCFCHHLPIPLAGKARMPTQPTAPAAPTADKLTSVGGLKKTNTDDKSTTTSAPIEADKKS